MAKVEQQTRNAFDFIEKLYVETSYLLREVESHLQEEGFVMGRRTGYGVTMIGSSGLEPANVRQWLRKRLAVFFCPHGMTEVKGGVTVTGFRKHLKILIVQVDYEEEGSDGPVVLAACIRNIKHKKKQVKKFENLMWEFPTHGDSIFSTQPDIEYEDSSCSFIGRFFRENLFSINNSDDIREKLVDPMLKLYAES